MITEELQKNAMLAVLTIETPSFTTKDTRIVEVATSTYGVSHEMVLARKRILPREALTKVERIRNKARQQHKFYTLPYPAKGYGILPVRLFQKYDTEMTGLQRHFNAAVEELVADWDIWRATAQNKLKGLYSEADLDKMDPRMSYRFVIKYEPIPQPSGFMADIEEVSRKRIQEMLAAENELRLRESQRQVWIRLLSQIQHISERLSNPDNIFRDTLIENLRELLEVLPQMQIVTDPVLQEMVEKSKAILTHHPQELRDDTKKREEIATKAKSIEQEITTAMAAMF